MLLNQTPKLSCVELIASIVTTFFFPGTIEILKNKNMNYNLMANN